ncbi:AI-2E family transporter, partial [Escherichia coli]
TFFASFIPIIGAVTAGALAVIIALVSNGLTNALLALALIIIVQQVEGNLLQPLLQSKAMGLHAAVVLLSVTVGSTLA